LEEMSKEELLGKMVSLSFSRFLKTYRKAKDLNRREPKGRKNRTQSSEKYGRTHGRRNARQRLFINVGSIDVGGKGPFISMICKEARISGQSIGRIDMQDKFTFFEVDEDAAEQVIRELEDRDFNGRSIRINAGDRFDRRNKRRSHRSKNRN